MRTLIVSIFLCLCLAYHANADEYTRYTDAQGRSRIITTRQLGTSRVTTWQDQGKLRTAIGRPLGNTTVTAIPLSKIEPDGLS